MRPSLLTWLRTSLSTGFASVGGAFLPSNPNLVLKALLAPVSSAAYPCCVEILTLSYHIVSQARRLKICNIELCDCAAVCSRSGISMFWTLVRVIIVIICASHGTCGVAAVFCAILISS